MDDKGQLFIIAAPSGAGKTSLVNALVKQLNNVVISISYTTRPKRPKDVDGQAYYFIDEKEFTDLIAQNAFLEHAQVFDHYYGTGSEWVQNQLQQGNDVILEIDWQGAQQVRTQLPESQSIFILPPSRTTLSERLNHRGQDSETVIEKRLAKATAEMQHYAEFDYLIVNDDFDTALSQLRSIIVATRLQCLRQTAKHAQLIADLLT